MEWHSCHAKHHISQLLVQRQDYEDGRDGMAMIRLAKCRGCGVTGEGTLNGNAQQWVKQR